MTDPLPSEPPAPDKSANIQPPNSFSPSSSSDGPPPPPPLPPLPLPPAAARTTAMDAGSSDATMNESDEPGGAPDAATTATPTVLDIARNTQPHSSPHASASEPVADTTMSESALTATLPTPAQQPTPPPPPPPPPAPTPAAPSPSPAPSPLPPSAIANSPSHPTDDAKPARVSSPPPSAAASTSSLSKDPASPPPKPRGTPPTTAATPTSAPLPSDPLSSPVKTVRPPPAPVQSPPLSAARAPAKSPVTKPAPPRVTPVKTSLPASASVPTSAAATPVPVPPSPLMPPTPPSSAPPLYPLPSNIQLALLAKSQGQTDAYGNTTRCICFDNDNSDGFMLSCDTCIAEGTPVALRYGLAAPIEAVRERGREVLAVKEGDLGAMCKSVVERGAVGSNVKGERAVCRMWLANGRFLDLTDDHPVFVRGREGESAVSRPVKELVAGWRHALNSRDSARADEDESEVAMVMMGVDAAVDDCRLDTEEERSWSASLGDDSLLPLSFSPLPLPLPLPLPPSSAHHSSSSHRDRALAFARVLGYVTGCGRRRLCQDGQPLLTVAFQHWLDVDEWVKDISLVMSAVARSPCKHTHSIRAGRNGRWRFTIPAQLSAAMCRLIGWRHAESGIVTPAFFDPSSPRAPIAFVREYVAALFGALGKPMRCKRSIGHHLQPVVTVTLGSHQSASSSSLLLTHISALVSTLGLDPSLQRLTHTSRQRKRSRGSTGTARSSDTSRSSLHVTCPITFSRLISYRYAALKQLHLSVVCAYLHYRNSITRQRLSYPAPLSASHSSAAIQSPFTKHIDSTMPTLHCSSSPSNPLSLPTFSDFLSIIGLPSLFTSKFSLSPTAISLPAYFLPIVALQPLPSPLSVYDLSMQSGHSPSFLASSVFVHNCEVWQHGDCLQVNERSVPEQYFCEICMPDHPIHVHNDSVKKSHINKRSKGKGKAAKQQQMAGLGSPQVEGRKSLEAKQKKDVKAAMGDGKKEPVKAAVAEKEKPKALSGAVVAGSAEAAKKKKTKRDDDVAVAGSGGAERRDGRDQQPAAKKARVDERAPAAAAPSKEKEEKQPAAIAAADATPSLTASASAGELSELGSDGMDAREKKKLKKLLETIQKMEDQNKKRKKPDGDSLTGEAKERDDTHVAVAAVQDDRAAARAADDDAAMDASSPTSPNLNTARSVRAKLRAEREGEHDPLSGQPLPADMLAMGASSSSAALTSAAAGSKKKKKAAAGSDSDEDTSDVVDFAFRRRRWQDTKRTSGSEMGPFYLGKKEWLLSGWRREKEREVTGWDDRVKEEEVGVVKRAIDNWREAKTEREEEARARELGTSTTTRRRMLVQRPADGVPTISKYEVVGSVTVAESDSNGDRKRNNRLVDDDESHDAADHSSSTSSSPLFTASKSNGTTAHTSTSSTSAVSHPTTAAAATASAAVSRPSIPKVSRGMLNGLGGKGGVGGGGVGRLSNNRQSSGTVGGGGQH